MQGRTAEEINNIRTEGEEATAKRIITLEEELCALRIKSKENQDRCTRLEKKRAAFTPSRIEDLTADYVNRFTPFRFVVHNPLYITHNLVHTNHKQPTGTRYVSLVSSL